MIYLPYQESQIPEIVALYQEVFSNSEGSSEGENIAHLVNGMFTENSAHKLWCFIAKDEVASTLSGAIIFTELKTEPSIDSYILSPVAVKTSVQGQGIGQALINFGIKQLKAQSTALLLTYGDPNYYSKVGFKPVSEQEISAPQPLSFPQGWLAQPLTQMPLPPSIKVNSCIEPLNKPDLW